MSAGALRRFIAWGKRHDPHHPLSRLLPHQSPLGSHPAISRPYRLAAGEVLLVRLMPSDPRYQQADAIQRGLMALTNAHTLGKWERVDMPDAERMAAMGELERAWYDLEWGRFLETVGD